VLAIPTRRSSLSVQHARHRSRTCRRARRSVWSQRSNPCRALHDDGPTRRQQGLTGTRRGRSGCPRACRVESRVTAQYRRWLSVTHPRTRTTASTTRHGPRNPPPRERSSALPVASNRWSTGPDQRSCAEVRGRQTRPLRSRRDRLRALPWSRVDPDTLRDEGLTRPHWRGESIGLCCVGGARAREGRFVPLLDQMASASSLNAAATRR
jgi:hypothetical protein